jgi:hypothetical protein
MTIEQRVQYLNVTANQDLTPAACLHKAVTVNGTIAPSAGLVCGFLKSKGLTGEAVRLADSGVVKVVAGAAVTTIGYPVTVTTSGFVIASSSGGTTIGRAFTAASSGDVFPIQTDCANVGQYNGT